MIRAFDTRFGLTVPCICKDHERLAILCIVNLLQRTGDLTAVLLAQKVAVDHILPGNVKRGSSWERDFPDEDERQQCVHRLGNLILLSGKKNEKASEHDLQHKKTYYLTKRKGTQVRAQPLNCFDAVLCKVHYMFCYVTFTRNCREF